MKLISWNVNGLRACITHGFFDFLAIENPDIICLQETKMQKNQNVETFDGYFDYWSEAIKKGYSGTLILTKIEPLNVIYGINDLYNDEGRVITLEFDNFFLVNVYSPNSKDGLLRLSYRMEYEEHLRNYLNDLKRTKGVILCGDLNVAHKEIDIKNPKANLRSAGFTIEERDKLSLLLESGFIDSYRYLYHDKIEYSWWSYRFNARLNNAGWRIDYFIVSESLKDKIKEAKILTSIYGSDHCPVLLEIF
ncbi:MAG TPA: exodeoxyribonuclease III [Candidatus Onthovivens sp.]|nr:exodeoxyribonuclease III [Candidatus Onthovivens sp.]